MSYAVPSDIITKAWVLFDQTSAVVYRAFSKRVRPTGVSLEQTRVLFALSRASSPLTRTEISRVVVRRPHTITALLQGMQRAGLIAKIRDDKNKKLVMVEMTQKGKEALKQVLQSQPAMELISSLSGEELHQLIGILEKLRDAALRES